MAMPAVIGTGTDMGIANVNEIDAVGGHDYTTMTCPDPNRPRNRSPRAVTGIVGVNLLIE